MTNTCLKCGAQSPEYITVYRLHLYAAFRNNGVSGTLCVSCAEKLMDWLKKLAEEPKP